MRDGDDWVINGQKLWTSAADTASHVWLAARTDPDAPKHRGISTFIVPMDTPGISVRGIPTMGGARTHEVFFEDARVPGDALIGEVNRGWYIIANALDHERVWIGAGGGLRHTSTASSPTCANAVPTCSPTPPCAPASSKWRWTST